jgi:hypothetical protein
MTQATTSGLHGMRPGDRVRLGSDSNRMRRVVAGLGQVESSTSFRMLLFVRPSRGFAKHVRRQKGAGVITRRRPWPPTE